MAPVGWYTSISSFSSNHIGSFMYMNYPTAKAIFMGGTTRRFPLTPFAFQECGVWWATALLADIVEHWERFNAVSLAELFDLEHFDVGEVGRLVHDYAPEFMASLPDDEEAFDLLAPTLLLGAGGSEADEWAALAVTSPEELVERFASNFFFGCESDDRTVAQAFAPSNPLGCELKVMLGSDLSHPDTPDFSAILPNAFRLVEEGLVREDQFRRFMVDNNIKSRHWANHTLKQAGLEKAF